MTRKSPLPGLSRGSAFNSLRKLLLFNLASRLNLLWCFRCGNPIETVAEFSIEHKEAWEGAEDPQAAFFDLENVAFSHLKCNCGAAKKTNKKFASSQEQKRAAFRRYYKKNKDNWNSRRNERRRKK